MDSSNLITELLGIVISLALLFFSLFAIFRTQRVINFYLNSMKGDYFPNTYYGSFRKRQYESFIKLSEKRWFYYNLKIWGVAGLFMSLLFLAAIVHAMFKVTFGIFIN